MWWFFIKSNDSEWVFRFSRGPSRGDCSKGNKAPQVELKVTPQKNHLRPEQQYKKYFLPTKSWNLLRCGFPLIIALGGIGTGVGIWTTDKTINARENIKRKHIFLYFRVLLRRFIIRFFFLRLLSYSFVFLFLRCRSRLHVFSVFFPLALPITPFSWIFPFFKITLLRLIFCICYSSPFPLFILSLFSSNYVFLFLLFLWFAFFVLFV